MHRKQCDLAAVRCPKVGLGGAQWCCDSAHMSSGQKLYVKLNAMHKFSGRPLSVVRIWGFPEVSQMGYLYRVVPYRISRFLCNLGKAKAKQDKISITIIVWVTHMNSIVKRGLPYTPSWIVYNGTYHLKWWIQLQWFNGTQSGWWFNSTRYHYALWIFLMYGN